MDDTLTDELEPDDVADEVDVPDQPRGPHVPDVLAALPFWTWIFGLLAIARLIWFVRETHLGPAPGPAVLLAYVSGLVPAVVAVLLPAVLFLRHPDALTKARTLVLGTVLFAAVEAMRVLSPALQPVFEQLTPGAAETPYLVPLALLYSTAQGLLATFAVANIGLGLAQSRRYLDRPWTRPIIVVAALVALLAAVARVATISRIRFDEITMTPTVAAYVASAVVLGVLSAFAWGYLAATVARGARAGEEPSAGWTLGALGAWLILSAFGLGAVASLAEPTPETQDLFTSLGQGIAVIYVLGYLCLLGSFLLGMPTLEPLEDDDEEDEDDDEGDEGDGRDDALEFEATTTAVGAPSAAGPDDVPVDPGDRPREVG